MVSGLICQRMIPCKVLCLASGTISVSTLPFLLKIPNTIVLLPAPRPRLPLMRLGPKYDSSTSTTPPKGDSCSQHSAIRFRISMKYRLTVFRFRCVNSATFWASRSRENSLSSSRNFFSEIREFFTYLFFVATSSYFNLFILLS